MGKETEVITPENTKTLFFYDKNGNLTQQKIQNNKEGEEETYKISNTVYDSMNRPVYVIVKGETVDNITKYEYNKLGNITNIFNRQNEILKEMQNALENIKNVKWYPASGEKRISNMVENRSEWCISRQRAWGVPIPILYCKDCGKPIINEETIKLIADKFRAESSDAWVKYEANDFILQLKKMISEIVKSVLSDNSNYRIASPSMEIKTKQ